MSDSSDTNSASPAGDANNAAPSTPFSVEALERQAVERIPFIPHFVAPNPPVPTPEQRRSFKIRGMRMMVENFPNRTPGPGALPAAYGQSMQVCLKAWEDGTVAWEDGQAYLWGLNGLIARGTIKDVQHTHYVYCMQGIRDYHFDPCREYHIRSQWMA
ncbi:hypothetical protein TWF696_002869 [Orbilia brochopaga]|uniref:Uncharacterized protein n=1 Tax=Orbilia brochopaga TaxID=3140254 RepID=A0AAV9U481_9PEZI